MPKPVKKSSTRRPSADPNLRAHQMMADHAARVQAPEPSPALDFQAQYKAHMAKLGAKGGKASGAKRTENIPKRTRIAIAAKAAAARWKGHAKKAID